MKNSKTEDYVTVKFGKIDLHRNIQCKNKKQSRHYAISLQDFMKYACNEKR